MQGLAEHMPAEAEEESFQAGLDVCTGRTWPLLLDSSAKESLLRILARQTGLHLHSPVSATATGTGTLAVPVYLHLPCVCTCCLCVWACTSFCLQRRACCAACPARPVCTCTPLCLCLHSLLSVPALRSLPLTRRSICLPLSTTVSQRCCVLQQRRGIATGLASSVSLSRTATRTRIAREIEHRRLNKPLPCVCTCTRLCLCLHALCLP